MNTKLTPANVKIGGNGAKMIEDGDKMWQVYSPRGEAIGARTTKDEALKYIDMADLFDINEEAFWKAIGYLHKTPCEIALLHYFAQEN